jgi:lysophospholipase L1-like esterase
MLVFVIGFACYFLGTMTMYKQAFPHGQIRVLSNVLNGDSPHTSKLSNAFFQTFRYKSDIVMIGDSITAGAFWNEIFTNVKIANRGISGDTTYDILRRMDAILSVSPKKAFVMVGINDIRRGESLDEIFKNYLNIVKALQSQNIAVYIQSTLECQKSKCGVNLISIRELNKKLSSYAVAHNIRYININKGLTDDTEGLLPDYTPDGVHLNGTGYLVWSKTISPYINAK